MAGLNFSNGWEGVIRSSHLNDASAQERSFTRASVRAQLSKSFVPRRRLIRLWEQVSVPDIVRRIPVALIQEPLHADRIWSLSV
jgi:hypothetical protein